VAPASGLGDELAVALCDLDLGSSYKETTVNFARHRQPEQYRLIVERAGAEEAPVPASLRTASGRERLID